MAMRIRRRDESDTTTEKRKLQDKERKQRKRLQEAEEQAEFRRLFLLTSPPKVPGCTLEVLLMITKVNFYNLRMLF